uniref:Succinate dehydrogenase hydrophobic subunit n=1 Tax=Kappaphycus striatus TaxID=88410 RepID=A0A059T1S0_9FLOR|nr:succinate dehydrogenase hydrophobic subunit [Kappaphycus striatus]AHG98599.1 succinate dehydrogenase hydrophobic subunit [Kappaphycus striatus]
MFITEWIILRFSVLFLLLGLCLEVEIIILLLGFIVFHVKTGIITILHDYVHVKKVKLIFLSLAKISSIEISKYILEFLL